MMNGYQTAGVAILAVYYGAYFIKLFGQKRKGIKTTQFGMGVKAKRTVIIERILQVVSILTVIAEALSVGCNAGNMLLKEVRILGLLMAVLGTVVFIVAMFTMQESWRAGIPESRDTKLVTGEIFAGGFWKRVCLVSEKDREVYWIPLRKEMIRIIV